jgi:hypothetical protein
MAILFMRRCSSRMIPGMEITLSNKERGCFLLLAQDLEMESG